MRKVEWKLVANFGISKQKKGAKLPEWKVVNKQDITDFLNCLVFIVNQPRVNELEALVNSSTQGTIVEDTPLQQVLDKIESIGPEFRKRIEAVLGIDKKVKYKEKWISGAKIEEFIKEQKQQVSSSFVVIAMTLVYESEIMQYGGFSKLGKLEKNLDNFFEKDAKVLCISTQETPLSSIKISQYLSNKEGYRVEDGRISINLEILNSQRNRDNVIEVFKSEKNNLLIIECRHTAQEQNSEELFNALFDIVKDKPSKKIILITNQDKHNVLAEEFRRNFENTGQYISESDTTTDLKDFDLKKDALEKIVVVFQEQEEVKLTKLVAEEELKSVIDQKVLSYLIENQGRKINIGSPLPSISDPNSPAYHKVIEKDINIKHLKYIQDDIFIVIPTITNNMANNSQSKWF